MCGVWRTAQLGDAQLVESKKAILNLPDHYYMPKTGDIVLSQCQSNNFSRKAGFEASATHSGFIWNHPVHGCVVVENTKFTAPTLHNVFPLTLGRQRGVRYVPYDEFLKGIDAWCIIRPLERGIISDNELLALEAWFADIDFSPHIAQHMNFATYLTVTIGPVYPALAKSLLPWTKLDTKGPYSMICSEFLYSLFNRLHLTDVRDTWQKLPFSLTSANPELSAWGKEILVKRASMVGESTRRGEMTFFSMLKRIFHL